MLTRSQAKSKEKDIDSSIGRGLFSTGGIRNSGCSCYLNCLVQIIANFSPIFGELNKINPENNLEKCLYTVIQNILQSNKPISINFFLNEIGKELKLNISKEQNFFDILNGLCPKIQVLKNLLKFDITITFLQKKSKVPYQIINDERFILINICDKKVPKPGLSEILSVKNVHFNNIICQKIIKLSSLPVILAIAFEYRSYEVEHLELDQEINLEEFCNTPNNHNYSYQLYAILIHMGLNSDQGHYIVYIRNFEKNKWFGYNDSIFFELKSFDKITSERAVVSGLFYINRQNFDNFHMNKEELTNERNLFCKKIFLTKNEINNTLINHVSDFTDESSEEEEEFFEEFDNSDENNSINGSDISIQNENKSTDENDDDSIDDDENFSLFHHGPIDYVDTRTHGNLEKYINEAPKIPNDIKQRPDHVQIDLSDQYFQNISRMNDIANRNQKNENQTIKKKRLYVKTTIEQRRKLTELYNLHQDDWSMEKYAIETGIRKNNCKTLIKKIRKNESLDFQFHQRGRKPKINTEKIRILENTLDNDPFLTLRQLQQKFEDEFGLKISQTQIWANIVGKTKSSKKPGSYVYSFKWASKRHPDANNMENKLLRKERIKELSQYLIDGFEWVCIDETRFDIGYVQSRGWSKKGQKLLLHRQKKGFSCSGITAIGTNGMLYCTLVRGSVTSQIYDAFLKYLVELLKADGPIVFWMDNSLVHKNSEEIFKNSKNKVIYNAPYSPEVNPIENIFGFWKNKIIKEIVQFKSEHELLDLIQKSFTQIDPSMIRRTFETTRWNIFPKIINLEDL